MKTIEIIPGLFININCIPAFKYSSGDQTNPPAFRREEDAELVELVVYLPVLGDGIAQKYTFTGAAATKIYGELIS